VRRPAVACLATASGFDFLDVTRDGGSSVTLGVALVVLGFLVVLLLVGLAALSRRVRRLHVAYQRLTGGVAHGRLDEVLQHYIGETQHVAKAVRELHAEHDQLAGAVRRAVQRVGLVRYSAFADTGGDQSFAVALLDHEGNGALFNGLFHRTECRVYAKPVERWQSRYNLSDEEAEAIRIAQQS